MSDSADDSRLGTKQDVQAGAPYKKGDFIGQKYEVQRILGKGGCGIVYLVYSQELGEVFALKTFKDEYLADQDVRKRFHKEASVWVELGYHPYLVGANHVTEVSGRLYIAMEYVAPNEEGLNSLDGYLERRPPDLAQTLRWGVQICYGMEYAYSKGVRAHRDLKPSNIMIGQDGTARITDFGLAGVLGDSPAASPAGADVSDLRGLTMVGTGFGTPAYMPPEQFDNAAGCDERSDIYSFGIVLYQMVAGGRLPFPIPTEADWQTVRRLQRESPVPRLDSPLLPIIQRCLEKSPEKRYQTFKEVRRNLEPLLLRQTGENIPRPRPNGSEVQKWTTKSTSLISLGRYDEAIRCCDIALDLDPSYELAWAYKGLGLASLGRHEDAIKCNMKALEIDPHLAVAWGNLGLSLSRVGRHEEAIKCYDKALEIDPHQAWAWFCKASTLDLLGRHEEAIKCCDKALEIDPRQALGWVQRARFLGRLGRHEEAIKCYDKALEIDPCIIDAWGEKGDHLDQLGRHEEAIKCYDKVLEIEPHCLWALRYKAGSLHSLGRHEEAMGYYARNK